MARFPLIHRVICAVVIPAIALNADDRSSQPKRPFRVQDSIEMTRILDPAQGPDNADPLRLATDSAGVISPDGAHVAALVTNGNLADNTNVYSLLVYETNELFSQPHAREIVRMTTKSSRAGIVKVKWLADNRRLAFLGEDRDGLPQIWITDVKTGAHTSLTHHPTLITDYDITPDGLTWVYLAKPTPPAFDSKEQAERGFVFSPAQSLIDVIAGRYGTSVPTLYRDVYIGGGGRKEDVKVRQECQYVRWVSISPDGRHVVEALQTATAPEAWKRYEDANLKAVLAEAKNQEGPPGDYTSFIQYFLIDTASATSRLLSGTPTWSNTPPVWTKDSSEIAAFQSFVPLSLPNSAGASRYSVVAFSIKDGNATVIRSEPRNETYFTPILWEPQESRLVLRHGTKDEYSTYMRTSSGWQGVDEKLKPQIRIAVKQSLNDLPELEAQEWTPGRVLRRSVMSHLNPQLDSVNLARVETIDWVGKDGLKWRGLLYLPPTFVEGKRYPLVIQTHGYNEGQFNPDGRSTTVMAAQPLANSDIVVVQLQGPTGWAHRSLLMAKQWMNGIESLIDVLAERRLVNPAHVGLTGWSYTGWLVEYFLTHSKYPIGAAVAADNIDYGYWQYLAVAARGAAASREFEVNIYGASPWERPSVWLEESTGFMLRQIQTPLRLESETDNPIYQWEVFAGLKLLNKPVELVVIPDGSHSLVRPWHRMTSQGGTLDWYRFWLKGEVGMEPEKAPQYARWQLMQSKAHLAREGSFQ